MNIVSWNVNSLRVRLPQLLEWLQLQKPDAIALQETKLQDKDFPVRELQEIGYQSVYTGQKTYNGVAILYKSILNLTDVVSELPNVDLDHRRFIAATLPDKTRLINVYVPNGQSVGSDKFYYKLDWLAKLKTYLQDQLTQYQRLVVLGDFNIAPTDADVHDPKAWEGSVHVSEPERKALQEILDCGLLDTFRLFTQAPQSFSWWDYRNFSFQRNNGLRIDLILASQELAKHCQSATIDKLPRKYERPSDHTPVLAQFI